MPFVLSFVLRSVWKVCTNWRASCDQSKWKGVEVRVLQDRGCGSADWLVYKQRCLQLCVMTVHIMLSAEAVVAGPWGQRFSSVYKFNVRLLLLKIRADVEVRNSRNSRNICHDSVQNFIAVWSFSKEKLLLILKVYWCVMCNRIAPC
jgi:hypothetical protein